MRIIVPSNFDIQNDLKEIVIQNSNELIRLKEYLMTKKCGTSSIRVVRT